MEVKEAMGSTVIVRTADGFEMYRQREFEKRGVSIVRDGPEGAQGGNHAT